MRLRSLADNPEAFSSDVAAWQRAPRKTIEAMLEVSQAGVDGVVLGAFDEGLIGLVGVKLSPRPKVRHVATLWGLFVTPEHRRRGVGKELVRGALQAAGGMEAVEQVRLMTPSGSTPATRLFARLGFSEYGCELRGRRVGEDYINLAYLWLPLAS